MSSIQITYEDDILPLDKNLEHSILQTLTVLLKKMNRDSELLSLFFCSSATIQQLNATYREKDVPTDILSWSYQDDESIEQSGLDDGPWGELVICLEIVEMQAGKTGWTLEKELARLLVHGLVHLIGYDHETEDEEKQMLSLETELLSYIGLNQIYP